MKYILTNQFFSSFVFLFFLFVSSSFSQGDNPLVDRMPEEMLQINTNPLMISQAVTVDGYDNYYLGVAHSEPHVSQNPLSPTQFFGAYNINNAWYTNDGHDWTYIAPNFQTNPNGDPCTAYDVSGNLFYETMYGGIVGCKVIRSTDNGATWSNAVTSVSGGDKNWIAADQTSGPYSGYIYTSMTSTSFNAHNFARSTDNGATWTQTYSVSNSPLPGAMIAVGPSGTTDGGAVYLVTNQGSTFSPQYGFHVSTDGGATFNFKSLQSFAGYVGTNVGGRHTVQTMRTRPYPFIAADNSNGAYRGRLYLVYASNTPAGNGNKPDIFCRYSTDMGTTWSNAVVINDDANTTTNNQWHPSIWCDVSSGRLFCKWMDTRDTPTSDSAYIYASYSDDGGVTWASNQRVSNQKMKVNWLGGGGPFYMGDYDAIVSSNNQALAMWTDFRQLNEGSYVGYFPDFAMTISPNMITLPQNGGQVFVSVDVPDVKLYDSDAIFSASVSPLPSNGTITLDFPGGNTISSFPGSVQLRVQTSGNVTVGAYTITIQGEGLNGTPVHRRTVDVDVVVPVELTSFAANVKDQDVVLNWITASETNNRGFEIERRTINTGFVSVGFINGKGTITESQSYSFIDKKMLPGSYTYRLKQIDFDGSSEYSQEVEAKITNPIDYVLSQNYPNPFNPSTTISYSIPEDGNVTIKVYDILGNEVASLVDEFKQAGKHDLVFNASNLSSGVYYYKMTSAGFSKIKKLMLMK